MDFFHEWNSCNHDKDLNLIWNSQFLVVPGLFFFRWGWGRGVLAVWLEAWIEWQIPLENMIGSNVTGVLMEFWFGTELSQLGHGQNRYVTGTNGQPTVKTMSSVGCKLVGNDHIAVSMNTREGIVITWYCFGYSTFLLKWVLFSGDLISCALHKIHFLSLQGLKPRWWRMIQCFVRVENSYVLYQKKAWIPMWF